MFLWLGVDVCKPNLKFIITIWVQQKLLCSAFETKLWWTVWKAESRWPLQKNVWFEQPICTEWLKILPYSWWSATRWHAWHPWKSSSIHSEGYIKGFYLRESVFIIETLNTRITAFDFGYHNDTNKVSPVERKWLLFNDNSLRQHST